MDVGFFYVFEMQYFIIGKISSSKSINPSIRIIDPPMWSKAPIM